jgi:DNA helicase II / ATP-dependent DNA helicase PcrA
MSPPVIPERADEEADSLIRSCINLASPKSFFLYAGAGSGKTRSLVHAIHFALSEYSDRLALEGKQIGVITYTNAACDEIRHRLEFNPQLQVSTIHSFAWMLIAGFNIDIRQWLSGNLAKEIAELENLQARGRSGTKASADRARAIQAKSDRVESLSGIRKFIYSPTGDNRTRDSLNHAEVIGIAASFLSTKPRLRELLVSRFPILFIDESQDTNRHLMDALLSTQATQHSRFCLGLFGDTMQRIYSDGKVGLAASIPDAWSRPEKLVNHRSPQRIVRLINRIRMDDDRHQQIGRTDKPDGVVRLFPLPSNTPDRIAAESAVASAMAEISGDQGWKDGGSAVKSLILEHHMAARRLGFEGLFGALYGVENYRTGLLNGTLPGVKFYTGTVLPLIEKIRACDRFGIASIVKRDSSLLTRAVLAGAPDKQVNQLAVAQSAVTQLAQLITENQSPTLRSVLQCVASTGLFDPPESLLPFAESSTAAADADPNEEDSITLAAWRAALDLPLDQMVALDTYLRGDSQFGTHQGVKGLEFPRVMVIVDDQEARGFLFSYEKLFGVKEKSKSDQENEDAGKETTIERTRRLFYVTCSRAEDSLAVVCYSEHPDMLAKYAVDREWFEPSEVMLLQ